MKRGAGLNPAQAASVLRALARIDRPLRLARPPEGSSTSVVDTRRLRFGLGLVLTGIFLLVFCTFLPADGRRGWFVAAACIVFLVGIWHVDRPAKRERSSE